MGGKRRRFFYPSLSPLKSPLINDPVLVSDSERRLRGKRFFRASSPPIAALLLWWNGGGPKMIPRRRRRHSPMPHRSVQSPNQKLRPGVGREQDLCDRGNYLLSGEGLNIFSSLRPSPPPPADKKKLKWNKMGLLLKIFLGDSLVSDSVGTFFRYNVGSSAAKRRLQNSWPKFKSLISHKKF